MTITSGNLFPTEIVTDIFNAVKGKSSIARMSSAEPIPYTGTTQWVMSMDGEASVVTEGAQKPAGNAAMAPVVIKPFKVVYQTRVTDEFLKMSDEERIPHMEQFEDGLSSKIARAVDIVGFSGIDPATRSTLGWGTNKYVIGAAGEVNHIESASTREALPTAIETIIEKIQTAGYEITGTAFSPIGASTMGKIKNEAGFDEFPEFKLGNHPETFAGGMCEVNSTVAYGDPNAVPFCTLMGDWNALRWGYCDDIEFDVIEYGNPDGLGDLKQNNEVCLRAEAYIGLGILDKNAFGAIQAGFLS